MLFYSYKFSKSPLNHFLLLLWLMSLSLSLLLSLMSLLLLLLLFHFVQSKNKLFCPPGPEYQRSGAHSHHIECNIIVAVLILLAVWLWRRCEYCILCNEPINLLRYNVAIMPKWVSKIAFVDDSSLSRASLFEGLSVRCEWLFPWYIQTG